MMKTLVTSVLVAGLLSGCASSAKLTGADYADSASTAAALKLLDGATEGNPLVGIAGDSAAPVVGIGIKFAARQVAANSKNPCQNLKRIEIASTFGTANNVAIVLTGGQSVWVGPLVGLIFAHHKAQAMAKCEVLLEVTE
jgi:uncharacterized lipoprotein